MEAKGSDRSANEKCVTSGREDVQGKPWGRGRRGREDNRDLGRVCGGVEISAKPQKQAGGLMTRG